jgi:DNA-binding NtrC family response regulator
MKKILVVDDSPSQLTTRKLILERGGFGVHTADNVSAALDALRADNDIGLVITDHIMPKSSGAEFVKLLREVRPEMPVAVISGLAEAVDEYRGMGVSFHTKPCPPPELLEIAEKAVGSGQS